MRSSNIEYIEALDHLRGFAALLIILYHGLHLISYKLRFDADFTFNNWLQTKNIFAAVIIEGHTAVAFFMVLSGFIFTYGSYGKEIIYSKFIINRLLRTYPLFIFLLFVGIYSFPERFNFVSFLQTLTGFANASNGLHLKSFTSMFWAIAVEWQFYILFPFLLVIAGRNGLRYLAGIILAFVLFRVLAFFEGANVRDLAYRTIIGRMDQFILGMFAGVFFLKHKPEKPIWYFLFLISLSGILVSLFVFHKTGGWPAIKAYKIFWPGVEGTLWSLFIVSYIYVSKKIPRFISKKLTLIGLISYSLYLVHCTIITIMINKGFYIRFGYMVKIDSLLNTFLFVIPATFLVSFITYNFIEKPFLNMRVLYHKT